MAPRRGCNAIKTTARRDGLIEHDILRELDTSRVTEDQRLPRMGFWQRPPAADQVAHAGGAT